MKFAKKFKNNNFTKKLNLNYFEAAHEVNFYQRDLKNK